MQIHMAHLREQGINFAVFDADARSGSNSDRAQLLAQLTASARAQGLRIEKSALAYSNSGRTEFYGAPDLVRFLAASGGVVRWTHTIAV